MVVDRDGDGGLLVLEGRHTASRHCPRTCITQAGCRGDFAEVWQDKHTHIEWQNIPILIKATRCSPRASSGITPRFSFFCFSPCPCARAGVLPSAVCPEFDTRFRLSRRLGTSTSEAVLPRALRTGVTTPERSLTAMLRASAAKTSAIGSNDMTLPDGPVVRERGNARVVQRE